jgi:hypothetical protein
MAGIMDAHAGAPIGIVAAGYHFRGHFGRFTFMPGSRAVFKVAQDIENRMACHGRCTLLFEGAADEFLVAGEMFAYGNGRERPAVNEKDVLWMGRHKGTGA